MDLITNYIFYMDFVKKILANRYKLIITFILLTIFFISLYIFRPIKIGVLFTLDSSIGNEEYLALKYFVKKNPKIGLRRVKLYYETPILVKEELISSFNKLESLGVKAIIGCSLSQEGVAIAPLTKEHYLPVLSPTASSIKLTVKDDFFYSFILSSSYEGIYPAQYLNGKNSKRAILLLSEQNRAYSESIAHAFNKIYKGESKIIFNIDNERIKNEIRDFDPDHIYFITPSNELVSYLKFLKKQMRDTTLLTSTWGAQQLLSVYSGPQLDNIIIATVAGPNNLEDLDVMKNDFENIYKINPTYIFEYTISTMRELYNSISKNGSSKKSIIKYFNEPHLYDSPSGTSYMDSFGDTLSKYYYFFKIVDNKPELIIRYDIEEFKDARKKL